jgi:hypothetical protein
MFVDHQDYRHAVAPLPWAPLAAGHSGLVVRNIIALAAYCRSGSPEKSNQMRCAASMVVGNRYSRIERVQNSSFAVDQFAFKLPIVSHATKFAGRASSINGQVLPLGEAPESGPVRPAACRSPDVPGTGLM